MSFENRKVNETMASIRRMQVGREIDAKTYTDRMSLIPLEHRCQVAGSYSVTVGAEGTPQCAWVAEMHDLALHDGTLVTNADGTRALFLRPQAHARSFFIFEEHGRVT